MENGKWKMNVTRRARLLNHRALRDTTILNSPFSILNLFYKIKKLLSQISLGTGANTLLRYHPD